MKRFLMLTLLFLTGCFLFGDTHSYKVEFTPNTEPDMSHYKLYVWSGEDTTQCPFYDGHPGVAALFVRDIPHPPVFPITFPEVADGKSYISVLMTAVDSSGNRSNGAWATVKDKGSSHFLLSVDGTPPAQPADVTIDQ